MSFRASIFVFGAVTCLALGLLSARRTGFIALAATVVGAASPKLANAATDGTAIRPFRVSIPEKELVELRRRIATTRWPTKELVEDRSQGVQLATLKALSHYWATDYDWRKAETKLNAYPQLGWDSSRIARAWGVLMERLGYARYVAQGGDVGAAVTDAMVC